MSVSTYKYIIDKLPDELVIYINEYVNIKTEFVLSKMNDIIKINNIEMDYLYPFHKNITYDYTYGDIYRIMAYVNIIKRIYLIDDIGKDGTKEIKHFGFVCRLFPAYETGYCIDISEDCVDTGHALLSFIIAGFKYEYKDNKHFLYLKRRSNFSCYSQVIKTNKIIKYKFSIKYEKWTDEERNLYYKKYEYKPIQARIDFFKMLINL